MCAACPSPLGEQSAVPVQEQPQEAVAPEPELEPDPENAVHEREPAAAITDAEDVTVAEMVVNWHVKKTG